MDEKRLAARKRRLMREQRFLGAILLFLCLIAFVVQLFGRTPGDRDCGVILLFAIGGVYLLRTNKLWLW